jgi:hypothetical protein
MRENDRKKDTRQKIELGGLVVKAGLRGTDKAVILGILTEAAKRLSDNDEHKRYRAIGKAAFNDDDQKSPVDDLARRPDAGGDLGPDRD